MFRQLTNLQQRQAIDAQQAFEAYLDVQRKMVDYAGGMHWKTISGREYLYRTLDRRGNAKSLGPRSPKTETIFAAFTGRKTELAERLQSATERMKIMRRMNTAARLGSAPNEVADVCEVLQSAGIDKNFVIIGTNALYCYEALAGVRFDSEIKATMDIDLLWDTRKRLSLVATGEAGKDGLIGLLRKADKTYEVSATQPFRAINKDGYMVDLIRQTPTPPWKDEPDRLAPSGDLVATDIAQMKWMLNAPTVSSYAIAMDGRVFEIRSPEPAAFASYKRWLSTEPSREPVKRKRDLAQADAVQELIEHLLPQYSQAEGDDSVDRQATHREQ